MLYLSLDENKKRSYTKQIYMEIRKKILSGELKSGEMLPSSRDLSNELSVARNTVLSAYDMLISEGAIYSVAGSGFYVCSGIKNVPQNTFIQDQQTASLSNQIISNQIINFDSGLPALDLFPREKWNRVVSHAFLDAPVSALGYDHPQGRPEFRDVLCSYLKKTRGISCTPEQIIITTGAKQGLSLAAKCLLHSQSEVWIENPSNANVKNIFSYYTNNITPFEVDHIGIQPEQFPYNGKPDLIFTTPSHQFPMGGILPMQRKIALIEFAQKSGAYLLEDDYDSTFTYDALPSNSLFELNNTHVIYVGTFSKILFPSIRLGYLVVPVHLISRISELKRLADHHSNSIYQLAAMRFIENGDLDRHIRRMKKEYKNRRDLLLQMLHTYFKKSVCIYGAGAGMHIVAEFDKVLFSNELMKNLLDADVYTVPVEHHSFTKGTHQNQIILGYASLGKDEMETGIKRLKEIIETSIMT
ncbi:MAG: PLP-dependent aminotransferase family protein [Lachnospiraceae bacterium]|nr:PLP-dependent aminotransferase family protein [Lachnospiraceae bacterium]